MGLDVVPVYAQGIFTVSPTGLVNEILIFDYKDPGMYYQRAIEDGTIDTELEKIAENMQYFLDQEKVYINGERVRPRVLDVAIAFRDGNPKRPYIEIVIKFEGKFKKGVNRYEDYYEEEVAEYPYEILWIFPENARIIDAEIAGEVEILGSGNILRVLVDEGTNVGGKETITFVME